MNTTPTRYQMLAKEFSGVASEKEKEAIAEWIDSSEEARAEYEAFVRMWNERYFTDEDYQLIGQEEVGNKLWEEAFESEGQKKFWFWGNANNLLRVAAVLILTITVVFFNYLHDHANNANESMSLVEKQTLPGQKSTITLPDGSTVWLNSGSRIRYNADFGDNARTLELEGQAFFDVFKNPNNPFIVKCRNINVLALGTSFDVKAYEAGEVQVSLLSGKVKLTSQSTNSSGKNHQLILTPGQYSILDQNNIFSAPKPFDEYDVLAWKNGRLIFHDLTLDKIIPTLELWYGIPIVYKTDTKSKKHFNGTFERESLQNILENMSLSIGFEYQFEGDTVVLK